MSLRNDSLVVAVIQSKLIWEDRSKNRSIFEDQILSISSDVDLIVLPEMFSTGFTMNTNCAESMDGETIVWMQKMAKKKNAVLCGSLIISENGRVYNRLIWMHPGGTVEHYDKRHLFSFANEDKYFSPGTEQKIFRLDGWRFNVNICYDLRFPVALRNDNNYDCLLFVANWPAKRATHWKTLLAARAIENLSYVIACNRIGEDDNGLTYAGDSAVIGPDGISLQEQSDESSILIAQLSMNVLREYRETFAFANDADKFQIVSSLS